MTARIGGLRQYATQSHLVLVLAIAVYIWIAIAQTVTLPNVLFLGLLYAGVSESWSLTGKYLRRLSLGHAAYFGMGAYFTLLLYQDVGVPMVVGLLVGGVAAGLTALPVELATGRLQGVYYGLATYAVAQVVYYLALSETSLTHGPNGVTVSFEASWAQLMFSSQWAYVGVGAVYVLLVIAVVWVFTRSPKSMVVRAIGDDPVAAAGIGVRLRAVRTSVGALSAFLTGVGGGLYAIFLLYTDPSTSVAASLSLSIALYAIIGGLGTSWGPMAGALFLVGLQQGLTQAVGASIGGSYSIIYGVLLVIVLVVSGRGNGLLGFSRRPKASTPAPPVGEPGEERSGEFALLAASRIEGA